MKIGSRGGHTKASYGAVASLDEYIEAKKVFARVSELLSPYHVIVDCTPSDNSGYGEWNIGVGICNSSNCDIFFSIHFNSTIGAKGCECCVHPSDNEIRPYANRVLSNLAALGLVNRGIKNRDDLAETSSIKCPSMIIEVCFVQEPDASLYRSLGVEKIARAIANGIDSRVSLSSEVNPMWKQNSTGWWYDLGDGSYPKNDWKYINGEWYWFDGNGYAFKNKWLNTKDKWYWFDENCKMVKSTVLNINGKFYAFNGDGAMYNGKVDTDNSGAIIL